MNYEIIDCDLQYEIQDNDIDCEIIDTIEATIYEEGD
jgi:hypothetical protein